MQCRGWVFCVSRATVRCPPRSSSQHAVAPTTRRPVSKPKGKTPTGADGAPCDWDERDGCWRESDGAPYDKKAAAARTQARWRAARSAEQARAERDAKAAAQQARRAAFTAEQARAERDAQAAAQQARRAAFTAEEARAEQDAQAAAHLARRAIDGWSPLKQALLAGEKAEAEHLLLHTMKRVDPLKLMRLARFLDPEDKQWVLHERDAVVALAEDEERAAGKDGRRITSGWMMDYTLRRWARQRRQQRGGSSSGDDEQDVDDFHTTHFYRIGEQVLSELGLPGSTGPAATDFDERLANLGKTFPHLHVREFHAMLTMPDDPERRAKVVDMAAFNRLRNPSGSGLALQDFCNFPVELARERRLPSASATLGEGSYGDQVVAMRAFLEKVGAWRAPDERRPPLPDELSFDERLANLAKSFPQFPDELLREKLTKYDGHVGHARIALVQALARPELDQEASLALSSAERARSMVRTPQSERVAAAWRCIWVG